MALASAGEKQNGGTTTGVQLCTEQGGCFLNYTVFTLNYSIYAYLYFPTAGCGWLPIKFTLDPLNYSSETFKDTYRSVPDFTQASVGFRHMNLDHHAHSEKVANILSS